MRKLKLIFIILMAVQLKVWAADAVGDYRSKATGDWNDVTKWEKCTIAGNPGTWADAPEFPPLAVTTKVTIISGHTITAKGNITRGGASANLEIQSGATLTMIDGLNNWTIGTSTRFPTLLIDGELFTKVQVNTTNFTIGTLGYFKTSYIGTQGWWSSLTAPTSPILNGTIEFNGSDGQRIPGFSYNNIIISGTGSKILTGTVTLTGLLTINSGSTLNFNSGLIILAGSGILLNGDITCGYGSLYFDGTTPTISGTGFFNGTFSEIGIGYNNTSNTTISISDTIITDLLTIDPSLNSSSLTIGPDSKVEVVATGLDIYSDNAFILQSSAGSTASFINLGAFPVNIGGDKKAIVERYITGGNNTSNFAHIISSPVSDQNIGAFLLGVAAMVYHDETDGTTKPMSAGVPSLNFLPGRGYFARRGSDGVVTFTGTLNISPISFSLVNNGFNFGWNCVGNPFTSSLSITSFLSTNSGLLNPSFANPYVYIKGGSPLYQAKGSGVNLQPGQGFYVKSAGTGSLSFTSAMQVHQNPAFYKKSSTGQKHEIILQVKSATDSTYTNVIFGEGMTRGLDVTYDAGLFGGKPEFMLYTKLLEDNGVNFFNQYLPDTVTTDLAIPVGFDCTAGSIVTFTAKISSLPTGYKVILEDRLLNIFTDLKLKDAKYQVAVAAGTSGVGRFYLHTLAYPTGLNELNSQKITTFAVKKEIYIKGLVSEEAVASVYDLMGRKMLSYRLQPSDMNIVNMDAFKTGVYIVKVIDKGVLRTDRVLICE